MLHLDLFSGIGGFALAVDEVWPGSEHIFCEIDPYCRALLKKRFEGSKMYGDIRQLTADSYFGRLEGAKAERQTSVNVIGEDKRITADTYGNRPQIEGAEIKTGGDRQFSEITADSDEQAKSALQVDGVEGERVSGVWEVDARRVDLLTGGFPCQPFSQAGKRRGTEDNRYLWPEMLRVIREFKPTWVIAENVRGLLTIEQGVVFEQVCLDLEAIGYEVQPFIIPAVAVNAPHRRDRVWFVAHAGHRDGQRAEDGREPKGQIPCQEDALKSERPNSDEGKEPAFNATSERCDNGRRDRRAGQVQDTTVGQNTQSEQERDRRKCGLGEGDSNAPDTETKRPQGNGCMEQTFNGENGGQALFECYGGTSWERNWLEVATELCGVDDGLPAELDELKLSKSKHRIERLKALGNSIVPHVALEILRSIKSVNDWHDRDS